ncbi:type II toxin-antitoxin system RelE family toxin [Tessaracoccus palaemonis]|nr:type II toxin-antitoxin system RelE/ParE family toxin [Tessaracoccus palaemonis]
MDWSIQTSTRFDKAIRKLDRPMARRVLVAVYALAELDEPQRRCKALTGPLAGLWRLRIGDYRVILDIRRGELVLIALDLDHRSAIYE